MASATGRRRGAQAAAVLVAALLAAAAGAPATGRPPSAAAGPESPAPRDGPGLERLRKQLYAADPGDRTFAAATLLERGTPETLKMLKDILAGPNDEAVRLSIIEAIDKRRDGRFMDALIDRLADRDAKVSLRAAAALGTFADLGVVERLARFLRERPMDEATLLAAVEALVRTEQREAVDVLIELLETPKTSPAARARRAAALAALRSITLVDLGDDPAAWAAWWRVNRDKTRFQWGAHLVTELRRQVQQLQEQLDRARRDAVRWALALAAALSDPKERAKFLKELLAGEYPELRTRAAQELAELRGVEGVAEALVQALTDRDAKVVAAVAAALGTLNDPRAAPQLLRLLGREEPAVRAAAARALGQLRAADALGSLLGLLADPETDVRVAAAESAGVLSTAAPPGVERVFDGLVALVSDTAPAVRAAAVAALATFKDPRVTGVLVRVLTTDREAPRARFFAARALADLAGPEVDDALVKGLADTDVGVRQAAAAALGKQSDPALVDPLVARALTDEAPTVKQEAWSAVLALLDRLQSLSLIDRVSQKLVEAKAYPQAAEALEVVVRVPAAARPEEAAFVAALRRRQADAWFLAENWARAAALYRPFFVAGGDALLQARLLEALEKSGDWVGAAQVRLAVAQAQGPATTRPAQVLPILDLAEKAVAGDRPQEAFVILRSLRAAAKASLEPDLETRFGQVLAQAIRRLDELALEAKPRVKDLLGKAAGADVEAARAAAADLAKLGLVAVPALLEGLADADPKVRAAAVGALRALSGTTRDFNPAGTDAERQAGIARWRDWYLEQRTVPKPGPA